MPVATRAQQFSAIANVPGVISFNNPKVGKNDWSPRIGFAYAQGTINKVGDPGRPAGHPSICPIPNLAAKTPIRPWLSRSTQDVNDANPVSNFLANGGLAAAPPTVATTASRRAY